MIQLLGIPRQFACIALAILASLALLGHAADDGWIELFNGKDLTGWKRVALDPDFKLGAKNPWSVDAKNKLLLCDGVDVKEMLLHEKPFKDGVFHLEWRFRKVEGKDAGYNSGAYVRSKMDGKVWLQTQIAHLEKPPFVADVFGDLPQNDETKRVIIQGDGRKHVNPVGDWNTFDITCQGPEIVVRLNGTKVTEMNNCPWRDGHVGMQAEFFFIEFKNIRFKQ